MLVLKLKGLLYGILGSDPEHVVSLTVVDGFEGGDTNTTSITVHVSRAPEINPIDP